MPRGFLVKRSARASRGSYRIRDAELQTSAPVHHHHHGEEGAARPLSRSPLPRCVTSPAAADSLLFSSRARIRFTAAPLPFLQNRKPKISRKPAFRDEVTSSPVLGLRITAESPERARETNSSRTPLGEFICQLCREQYTDPLSLAQHRCSRIVRVEYRCPECGKVFSCPANLASHRRWHKPRGGNAAGHETGKENASEMTVKRHLPHPPPPLLLPPPPLPPLLHPPPPQLLFFSAESARLGAAPPDDGDAAGEETEEFACHCCAKKFRRRAYLRKHLAAHQRAPPNTFTCHLCGARFPSAEVREKHRVWHALVFPPKPSRLWQVPN